jgi:hypothetical protein
MIEVSNRMRKKTQLKGSMRIQSCRPETHSVSLTGWSCSESDIARGTSGATVLMFVLESAVTTGGGCWSESGGPGGEDIVGVMMDGRSEEGLQVCYACNELERCLLMSCKIGRLIRRRW